MAELNSHDRLQPSLLDRLTDSAPSDRQETVEARVLTRQQLRQAVLRDLSWLFNATRAEPEGNSTRQDELALWARHGEARRSVVNYGMPAFAGSTLSSMDKKIIEREVARVIRDFEPRISPDTLVVEAKVDPHNHHNTLQLTIRGQMWNQPVPLELLLAADLDVETGNTRVRDLRA
jgi:type VI secretion system protein ImpF